MSAHTPPTPSRFSQSNAASGQHSSKGDDPSGKKGKGLTSFFKGLFSGNQSSKGGKAQQSGDGATGAGLRSKSFSSVAPSPASSSHQASGNSTAAHVEPSNDAALFSARNGKSSSFTAAQLKAQSASTPTANTPTKLAMGKKGAVASLLADEVPGSPIGGGRQHSYTFMELRAQAQVVPTKGNSMLGVAPNLPSKMARPMWTMKDYAIVEKMYKGYASTVYKAFCKRSGELVCLKAYDMANLCELNRFQIYREVQLHSKLQHPNIITLFGAFQQDNQVVLVQEFADGGDLFTLLHRYGGRLPEKQAVEMVLQPFLTVLNYLHSQGILHRDLKPENILFTRTLGLKLCDFGLAIDLRDERAVTRAGTLEYMAPEVLKCPFKNKPEENKEANRYYYDISVDAWAVGVLIYELLVGFPPFNDKNRPAVEEKIRTDTPRFPSNMSEGAAGFIGWVLQKDPLERPTIMDMLHHGFVQGGRAAASKPAPAPAAPVQQPAAHAAAAAAAMAHVPHPPQHAAVAAVKGGGALRAKAHVFDEDDDTVIRPKNTMQSFTAGKAIQISNKALPAQGRHMEIPRLEDDMKAKLAASQQAMAKTAGAGERLSPNLPAHLSHLSISSNAMPGAMPGLDDDEAPSPLPSFAAKPGKGPLAALQVSRTASVPQFVHNLRPPAALPLSPGSGGAGKGE